MNYKTNEGNKKNGFSVKDLFFNSIRGFVGAVTGFYMMFNDWRANITGDVVYHHTTPGGTDITYQLNGTVDYNSILHPLGGFVTALSIADIAYSLYKTHKINKEIEKLNSVESQIIKCATDLKKGCDNLGNKISQELNKTKEDYSTKFNELKGSIEIVNNTLSGYNSNLRGLENVIKQYDNSIGNILSKVSEYGTKVDGLKQSLESAISLLSSKVSKEERKNILTKGGADDQ